MRTTTLWTAVVALGAVLGALATVVVAYRLCPIGVRSETMRVLTLLLVQVLVTSAATAADKWVRYGAGITTCGSWVAQETALAAGAPQPEPEHHITLMEHEASLQWVLGYIGAYGRYLPETLKQTDVNSITLWIDNYCQRNPVDDIERSANKLIEALRTGS